MRFSMPRRITSSALTMISSPAKSYTEALELKSMKHGPGEERVLARFEEVKNSSVSHLDMMPPGTTAPDSCFQLSGAVVCNCWICSAY